MSTEETELHYAQTRVGRLHYATAGRGAPVLLLHQSPRSWDEYRDVLPLLGRRYRAIAMDTVGFGASARLAEPPTIEAYGRGAIALLDALAIPQVAIVGHHTGGVVAVEVATTVPDRVGCLVLSGTTCVDPVERAREVRPSVDEVPVAADGSHLLALWRKREPYYPPQRPDLLQRFVLDALKVFDRVEEGHQAVREYAIRERLPRVEAPTLLVCGTEDWNALPAQEMLARLIPNSRSRLVPGAGVPMVDHMPEVFAQIVTEYLEEIGYGTAYQ